MPPEPTVSDLAVLRVVAGVGLGGHVFRRGDGDEKADASAPCPLNCTPCLCGPGTHSRLAAAGQRSLSVYSVIFKIRNKGHLVKCLLSFTVFFSDLL